MALVIATRDRLADVYSLPLLPAAMREHKAEPSRSCPSTTNRCAIANGAARDYDGWFARVLNNANLLPVGLYDEWVPAFSALFGQAAPYT